MLYAFGSPSVLHIKRKSLENSIIFYIIAINTNPLKSFIMKKRFLSILGALLLISISAIAAEYHYGFITTCGVTGYKTFAYELTDAEVLFWSDYFEAKYCRESMPIE